MSNFKVNYITNKVGDYGPTISGVSTVSSTGAMRIPSGNTGMRVEYSSIKEDRIVKDGLILHLDFANPECLVNGTTVRDLSGAGVVPYGTISGEAIYSPDGGGSLYFNNRGGIDFGTIPPDSPFNLESLTYPSGGGEAISVCSWVNVDMSKSANFIVAAWYATSSSGWGFSANENDNTGNRPMPAAIVSDGSDGSGAWYRPGWTGPNIPEWDPRSLNYWNTVKSQGVGIGTTIPISNDTFTHLGQTLTRLRSGTGAGTWGARTWINGLKNGMATPIGEDSGTGYTSEPGNWGSGRNLRIGRDDYASGSYMKGNIAVVMIYNRKLTHAEMQQNYNAQHYRFGR